MKLTVIGGTGGIGTQVIQQALAAGHEVTAPVRDPARMRVTGARLTVEPVDVLDPEALATVLKGRDAVVSALGPRRGDAADVLSAGARALVPAMAAAGVARLAIVSADGAFVQPTDPWLLRRVLKPLAGLFLRDAFADARRMEDTIRASDLDWTIVRPPRLTDGPYTGRYRSAVDSSARGLRISRADVAHALLRALATPATAGHVVCVSS